MVGAFVPSTPVDHQHIALKAVPGRAARRTCRASATRTTWSTARASTVAWSSAATRRIPVSRWEDGVPWEHAAASLPADYERFAPLMAGAIRRFPFLADAEAIRLVCHPDAMTPDAEPAARARSPACAASGWRPGSRSTGSGVAVGSAGRWPAGSRRATRAWTSAPYRAWRFGGHVPRPRVRRRPRPGDLLGLLPVALPVRCRCRRAGHAGCRRCTARLQEAGAVFGTKAGWERADHHEPGQPWRRAGRDQAAYGWTAPALVRSGRRGGDAPSASGCGLIDLSSFGKIAVDGPGALGLLQRVVGERHRRPVGSVVYTPWCDARGGMVADVTVDPTRADSFRVVTGAGYVAADLAWLGAHVERRGRGRSATSATRSRRSGCGGLGRGTVLAAATDDRATMTRCRSGPRAGPRRRRTVLATRISYAGRARVGARDAPRRRPSASGMRWPRRQPRSRRASSPSAIAPSSRSAWRRAIATSAPT